MVASILIILLSSVLLLYWFRYSCLLVLRSRKESSAIVPTTDPRFSFAAVQTELGEGQSLDPLHSALQHDYEVLTYLVAHASGLSLEGFDDRLLVLDYRVMQLWYKLTRVVFPEQARRALSEMASILSILAERVSEQAGIASEA